MLSAEGVQQGDPLGPLLFCLSIHKIVSSLSSEFIVFYLDDGTLGGSFEDLQADLHRIEVEGHALGLHLNVTKSELVAHNPLVLCNAFSDFAGLQFVHPDQATLLGSPLGIEPVDVCLEDQLHQLQVIGDRLCHLQIHDAVTILRHSFSIPKLLYVLCTSPCFSSSLLVSWDNLLVSIVSRITNIEFRRGDPAWLQATLPINSGGLGFRVLTVLRHLPFLLPLTEPPFSCTNFYLLN